MPWACKHASLNYVDSDRHCCWDADKFLDSQWILILNQETEKAFRNRVAACNPNIDDPCKMEEKILEMGKKAQVCVSEKEN